MTKIHGKLNTLNSNQQTYLRIIKSNALEFSSDYRFPLAIFLSPAFARRACGMSISSIDKCFAEREPYLLCAP